jgi:hypothetical protein
MTPPFGRSMPGFQSIVYLLKELRSSFSKRIPKAGGEGDVVLLVSCRRIAEIEVNSAGIK